MKDVYVVIYHFSPGSTTSKFFSKTIYVLFRGDHVNLQCRKGELEHGLSGSNAHTPFTPGWCAHATPLSRATPLSIVSLSADINDH